MDENKENVELLENTDKIEIVEENHTKFDDLPSRLDAVELEPMEKEEKEEEKTEVVEEKKEEVQIEVVENKPENTEVPKEVEPKKKSKLVIVIIVIIGILLVIGVVIGAIIIYEYNNRNVEDPYVSYKPIIYIYPGEEKDVKVTLSHPEKLTVTYPKYANSWQVHVTPDGDLTDKNGKKYYALYWEGETENTGVKEDGFVVEGKDTIKFLEEKLSILGLNYKESDEFIMYWLPKLESNKYNYIRFKTMDEINKSMGLEIEPKPDTLIRVLMEYKPLDEKINVKEQQLTKVERKGYTVVEWGGTNVD